MQWGQKDTCWGLRGQGKALLQGPHPSSVLLPPPSSKALEGRSSGHLRPVRSFDEGRNEDLNKPTTSPQLQDYVTGPTVSIRSDTDSLPRHSQGFNAEAPPLLQWLRPPTRLPASGLSLPLHPQPDARPLFHQSHRLLNPFPRVKLTPPPPSSDPRVNRLSYRKRSSWK